MAGTTNSVSNVETSKPPITATPIAIRPLAPSPKANAKGSSPKIVDTLVINIGRNR